MIFFPFLNLAHSPSFSKPQNSFRHVLELLGKFVWFQPICITLNKHSTFGRKSILHPAWCVQFSRKTNSQCILLVLNSSSVAGSPPPPTPIWECFFAISGPLRVTYFNSLARYNLNRFIFFRQEKGKVRDVFVCTRKNLKKGKQTDRSLRRKSRAHMCVWQLITTWPWNWV